VTNEKRIIFEPFCLDQASECLWDGRQTIKLRPKSFAVLDYLVRRPGQLITKEELLNAVWPGTFVAEGVLKVVVRQLRGVLGDDPKSPRFIETAHRRGYRFIGQVAEREPMKETDQQNRQSHSALRSAKLAADFPERVVGRDEALSRMGSWLQKMLGRERQIVFVTGEAGIGKTALVDTFVQRIAADGSIRIARGQCLEQYGASEAYLPVFDAIGRLCREQTRVIDVLRAHAPMWLLQMPSLMSPSDREILGQEVSGATRERMLREMGDALEVLTAEMPLVLILEDLHWSDYSTLDLVSYLATHRQAAQMMLIGTYRPVDLVLSGHPLKAVKSELLAKQQCEELPLGYLSKQAVERYLSVRFPVNRFSPKLTALLHQRTEGSPLFMVNAVDYLVAKGLITERDDCWELVVEIEKAQVGVPDSIKQMIEKQIDHLDAGDQRILEMASVAGAEFSAHSVAAGFEQDPTLLELRCDQLARQRQFIQDRGSQQLSNGEMLNRYGFIHALYQNVLYDRLPASRRAQVHQRIGAWTEAFYGGHAREIAAELAMHFDRAANYEQAIKYLQQAADNDIRRSAYREAVALSRRGLELVKRLPDTPERAKQELGLLVTLGVPLIATEGYAAPEVGNTYARARELCRQLGDAPEFPQVLTGLWSFHLVRADLGTAREIAQEFLRVAGHLPYSHVTMEVTLIQLGEFVPAIEQFNRALSLYDPERHRDDALRYSLNSGVGIQSHAAWALWFVGQPDEALNRMQKALTVAQGLSEPHGLAHAFYFSAILHQLRREKRTAQEHAEAALAIAIKHRLPLYQAMATIVRSWASVEQGQQEEAEELRRGLAAYEATGTEILRPHHLGLLAEALHIAGQVKEALAVVDEALAGAECNGEHYYDAELYRFKGELLLVETAGRSTKAEECFHQAMRIAQLQKARSLELRAATSLARHYQQQSRLEEARVLLARIYSTFTEGFDTSDMREAKALLSALS
jgi:predicted ATPase/DNA-binding winged helix-turn-helix (wHTH) protein